MWRNIASNAVTLLIVLVLALAAVIVWARTEYTDPGPLSEAVCLKVARGETMAGVSRDLGEIGAISQPALFRIGARYAGKSDDLKAGSFLISSGTSMANILRTVTEGSGSTCGREVNLRIGVTSSEVRVREIEPSSESYETVLSFDPTETTPDEYAELTDAPETRFRVTMAEGVTSYRAAEALDQVRFLKGDIDGTPKEGRLAPGSYEVERGAERSALIADMKERQSRILSELWAAREPELPFDDKTQALTLASIIEKETAEPDERAMIAGVFVNRLREGMRLQTDPAVIYGITKGKRVLDRELRQSELRKATPYNTYVVEGLPPTPIANPGRAAIEAATAPAETDAMFFVADGSGGHAFSETLAEHRKNVAKWRKLQSEKTPTQ